MKQKHYIAPAITLALALIIVGAKFVIGWTNPTQIPPAGNGIIYSNGTNIGIGTTVLTDKLTVGGNMSAQNVTGKALCINNGIDTDCRIYWPGVGVCSWISIGGLQANPGSGTIAGICPDEKIMKGIRFANTGGGDHNFSSQVSIYCCN